MTKNERRASQRFKARAGSYVSYVEGSGAIRDLSMDGIFILDSDPLASGTRVNFSVRLGNETAMFKGIVKRCVLQEGMGIQFQDVPRDLRRRLVSNVACISKEKEERPAPNPMRTAIPTYDGASPQIC